MVGSAVVTYIGPSRRGMGEAGTLVDDKPMTQAARTATYTHGYGIAAQVMARRTAEKEAVFFLPYLRPGMRLLDVGCGPGSVTAGLAQAVAPGDAVGIDIDAGQVGHARALAAERGIANVHFEVADAARLPFPDASFDAAFANTVLEHVADADAVVREMRRVLNPGGVIGIRDGDWGTRVQAPSLPLVEAAYTRYVALIRANGSNPFIGRRHRELLHGAGFTRIESTPTVGFIGTDEATRRWGETFAELLLEPGTANRMVELGLARRDELECFAAALREWGTRPDAVDAWVTFRSVGWAV